MSSALASSVEQIAAGLLDVGYVDVGPPDGPAVVLLHGWPYDIHTFADVSPLLAAGGYRVIVPYLRGHGTTRFLSDETFRNGQQSVLAVDTVALMDALGIEKAVQSAATTSAVRAPQSAPARTAFSIPRASINATVSIARTDCCPLRNVSSERKRVVP